MVKMMINRVCTDEISMDEWKSKLTTSDDDWLIRQYYGLSFIVQSMDRSIEHLYHDLRLEKGAKLGDTYTEFIYPLENEMMDVDIQLVDVEEEMEVRGLDILAV
jgi:hypothetical protein